MVLSHAAKVALKIAAKKLAITNAHRIKKTVKPRVRKTAKPRVRKVTKSTIKEAQLKEKRFVGPFTVRANRYPLPETNFPTSEFLLRTHGISHGKYGGRGSSIGPLGARSDYLAHVRKIRITKRQRKQDKIINHATEDWTRAFYTGSGTS